jgi:hypothetical protein
MTQTRHTVTLFCDEEGRYVLLRDGQVVEPMGVPGVYGVPYRLPDIVGIQVAIWGILEKLAVTPVRVWQGAPSVETVPARASYSVVLFCTRFSRRLESVLLSIAHQRDFDLEKLEVIVGYVPGLDGTEDVIDSVRLAHPELRVVHSTFPAQNARSKGYVLNESLKMAAGEWIMLLDADTLIPPDMFAALDAVKGEQAFVSPVGRAMLDREATAKILLGEIRPWECWQELVDAAPELRDSEAKGVPIGYCQCFRASCLEKVRYAEYDHFQGADFEFGAAMRKHFGMEYRLPKPVLHLDHGGSHWYGTLKQL